MEKLKKVLMAKWTKSYKNAMITPIITESGDGDV